MRPSSKAFLVALAIGGLLPGFAPAAAAATGSDGAAVSQAPTDRPELVELGVWDLPLALPLSLEHRRDILSIFLRSGQRRVRDFARRHKWQHHTATPLVQSVAIYEDKEKFDLAAARLIGGAAGRIPRTRVAAVRRGEMVLVSPDTYRDLAAEGIEADSYERLVAHELAHVLHARLLDGAEEFAGPEWFYEGFAVYAAGQFELLQQEPSQDEIIRVLQGAERGNLRLGGSVVRYFARKVPLEELVKRAGHSNFRAWLLQIALAAHR